MKTLLLLAALIPNLVLACINDRDTLAFEKRNVDALNRIEKETDPKKKAEAIQELVLRAIGGRFERFPAKYYEMRIERLLKKGSLTPPEYDDLAVAYDRIGKIDDAIKVILSSKSQRLVKDHRYSFHANYGTFLVHRWIANGHTDKDIKTLEESITEIKKALEINPKSHFGRENVQLALEESWLPENRDSKYYLQTRLKSDEPVVGAAGIIMMGLGYELPDIYHLLATSHVRGQASDSRMQDFATKRLRDLQAAGKDFIVQPIGSRSGRPYVTDEGYADLIADGEKVHQARTAYMAQRFARGEHPDTHSGFWANWVEPDYPTLHRIADPIQTAITWTIGIGGSALGLAIVLTIRKVVRRKRAL